jgi:hypothetical protein
VKSGSRGVGFGNSGYVNGSLNVDCALIPLKDEIKLNKYRNRKF